MIRKWLCITPSILLLAACSRSGNVPAAPAVVAVNPEPVAARPQPVGYANAASEAAPAAPAQVDAFAPPAQGTANRAVGGVVIPSGTAVHVRIDQTVDTRNNRPGDVVHATLTQPVMVGGRTMIPTGTRFTGHVTTSDSSGRLQGRAHIGVTLDSFYMNGHQYRLSTTSADRASDKHKKRNALLIGGGGGLGAALGAIAGGGTGALIGAGAGAAAGTAGAAATGKMHVTIPAETILLFTTRGPIRM